VTSHPAIARRAGARRTSVATALQVGGRRLGPSPTLVLPPLLLLLQGCAEVAPEARQAEVVSVLVAADQTLLRSRPALVAGKYARMARGLYDFFRGGLPVWAHDWRHDAAGGPSRFDVPGLLVPGLGDPHLENFGLLLAGDDTLALEPVDFDAADRYPYLWEVRRLLTSLVLACRLSNAEDPAARAAAAAAARETARAGAAAYAATVRALAAGAPRERFDEAGGRPVLEDLFRRGREDAASREELEQLTVVEAGRRRLRRGTPDPAEPEWVLQELPRHARAALPEALEAYRRSLAAPPPPAELALLDAVRELGSGVASWSRVRLLVLVRGPTDDPADDAILELKELFDSGAAGWLPPGVWHEDLPGRLIEMSRAMWSRPDADPRWSAGSWLGAAVQLRTECEANKTLRLRRLEGSRGTPEALRGLAEALGALLARVHAAPGVGGRTAVARIAAAVARDETGFADEQAAAATALADRVAADWELFRDALRSSGPTLGFRTSDPPTWPFEQRELWGDPPAPEAF
jgi:uncharacterized protein (DUF2252 family)